MEICEPRAEEGAIVHAKTVKLLEENCWSYFVFEVLYKIIISDYKMVNGCIVDYIVYCFRGKTNIHKK